VKAFISKRAAQAAERIDARWREFADDRGLFAREFLAVIDLLETTSGIGSPCPTVRHPGLRRILLPKSRSHVYFEVDPLELRILHVWDARRGRLPSL
jgi:plasmid stabilization system protein ParE